jgi:oligopeptide transport system substrate-binding protein
VDIPRLKHDPTYQNYPGLGTYYYGFNVKNIPDVNQRRAMAFAIDRQAIIDHIAQADQRPALSVTPAGMPGFSTIKSNYLEPRADIAKAKQLMSRVAHPVKSITLFANNAPGHKEIAVAIQAAWKKLGLSVKLKTMEWQQYLQFLGPPPNRDVDAYRLGWVGDFVDDINFLELFTCASGNNNTNWCNKRYDALIAQARKTPGAAARYRLYAQAEAILTGPNGDMPVAPIYWYTYVTQERPSVKDTFNINLLDQFDLSKVRIKG